MFYARLCCKKFRLAVDSANLHKIFNYNSRIFLKILSVIKLIINIQADIWLHLV